MKGLAILLGLVLVLSLVMWAGTAAAETAPDKWTLGERETISMEEGRGGYATVEPGRIVSAPEKFDVTYRELTPVKGRVPCWPEDGRGGKMYRMDFGEKWVF